MRGLRGRVVLVDFWDYTCVNCLRTLPYVAEWHKRYAAMGLTIIGVHTPEFSLAANEKFVRAAVERFRDPLSGRARQWLRDLARLCEPLLAREISDRQRRLHSIFSFW